MSYEYGNEYEGEMSAEEVAEECTKVFEKSGKIRIEFDAEDWAAGILNAVTAKLKSNLYDEIVAQIRKEVLEDMREKIQLSVHEIVKDIVMDFMQNEKIQIGGLSYWDNTPKEELTLIQYSKRCIKECIENGKFNTIIAVKKDRYSDRYRYETKEYSFSEYMQNNLGIGNEVKAYLDEEMDKVRKQINKDVKSAFDESTRTMLSQTVMNVLMANDTYRKIEQNIACIADKSSSEE